MLPQFVAGSSLAVLKEADVRWSDIDWGSSDIAWGLQVKALTPFLAISHIKLELQFQDFH